MKIALSIMVFAGVLASAEPLTDILTRMDRAAGEFRSLSAKMNRVQFTAVLSESTENYDRGTKLAHYKRIPSLRECVLISHRERAIEVWQDRKSVV